MVKVLIADDSIVYRAIIEKAVRMIKGVDVVGSVRDGVKTLQMVRQNKPDIIILDHVMPNMDGLTTLLALRECTRISVDPYDIGVIMIASHGNNNFRAGDDGYT